MKNCFHHTACVKLLKFDVIYVISIITFINFQFLTFLSKDMPKSLKNILATHKNTVL